VPGRLAAKKRGVKFGRKPKLTPEQVILALRLVDERQSVPQVADAFGVHETTIYWCLSTADAAA
jgi:DNA invertase Pin-like site-specific DNA recombinase